MCELNTTQQNRKYSKFSEYINLFSGKSDQLCWAAVDGGV
jgi:hypothetical protein